MQASDPIVLAEVGKRYGRNQVLKDLDLRVPKGGATALLGRNGAGKSTMLKILTGLLPRDGGEARVMGIDPGKRPKAVKEIIGYVPESTPFHPRWRVKDAIGLVRAIRKDMWIPEEEARLVDAFALPLTAKIGSLSKGYRAKLALLLALGHKPQTILLDEPASGLDPVVRREVLASLVDTITEEGRTLLFSSHLMEDVERLSDRIAFLAGGKIVLEGDAETIRAQARRVAVGPLPKAEPLGEVPGSPLVLRREHEAVLTYLDGATEAADALRASGRFEDVREIGVNLEDLFVDLLSEEREEVPCAT
jgi:ABC-2 type transport system ATP-binding protein